MLHAANEDRRFQGIIIDSSFAELEHMAAKIVEQEKIIPPFCRRLVKEIGLIFLQWDVGSDIREHSPRQAASQLDGIPVLFIHGKGDPLIPWTETQLLYESVNGPKQRYFSKVNGHYATLEDPQYIETINNFIATVQKE